MALKYFRKYLMCIMEGHWSNSHNSLDICKFIVDAKKTPNICEYYEVVLTTLPGPDKDKQTYVYVNQVIQVSFNSFKDSLYYNLYKLLQTCYNDKVTFNTTRSFIQYLTESQSLKAQQLKFIKAFFDDYSVPLNLENMHLDFCIKNTSSSDKLLIKSTKHPTLFLNVLRDNLTKEAYISTSFNLPIKYEQYKVIDTVAFFLSNRGNTIRKIPNKNWILTDLPNPTENTKTLYKSDTENEQKIPVQDYAKLL